MARLLLVDDSESNRLVLGSLLEDEGLDVDLAESFAAGASKLGGAGPAYDVVLLDQHLGDGLGSDLVPVVRRTMAGAKVLLLSGSGGEGDIPAAADVDGVLVKGGDFEGLVGTLRRLVPSIGPVPAAERP
jgi:DNA-binding response OmpR family regulator